jgi:hypothetical protein
MKRIFTFKKMRRLALVIIMLMIMQSGYGIVIPGGTLSFSTQNDCQITIKSLSGAYRNLLELKTTYVLLVENKGGSTESINLTVQNQKNCQNPDNSDTSKNPDLLLELTDATTNMPVTNVNLNPGASYTFQLKVVAPAGTPINTWSCQELKVTTANCPGVTLSLFSFNPDPIPE